MHAFEIFFIEKIRFDEYVGANIGQSFNFHQNISGREGTFPALSPNAG